MRFAAGLLSLLLVLGFAAPTLADFSRAMTIQGMLYNKTTGAPLTGTYTVSFAIYDNATGGALLKAVSARSIYASKGVFNTVLNASDLDGLTFDRDYWLEINVSGQKLEPRQRLAAAPYALAMPGIASVNSNIGIGTVAPAAKLEVRGTVKLGPNANVGEYAYGNWTDLGYGDTDNCDNDTAAAYTCSSNEARACVDIANNSQKRNVACAIGWGGVSVDSAGNFDFGGSAAGTVMYASAASGRVGIGTSVPGAALHVHNKGYGYDGILLTDSTTTRAVRAFTENGGGAVGIQISQNEMNRSPTWQVGVGTNGVLFFGHPGESAKLAVDINGNINIAAAVSISGEVYADKWLRTTGEGGWYSQKYGGGLYMKDPDWVRTYNNKGFYAPEVRGETLQANSQLCLNGVCRTRWPAPQWKLNVTNPTWATLQAEMATGICHFVKSNKHYVGAIWSKTETTDPATTNTLCNAEENSDTFDYLAFA